MLAKLALAIFLMANGSLVGPLAIGVKDDPFPTVQACEEFKDSDAGKALAAQAEKFAKSQFGDAATVVPQCVALTPEGSGNGRTGKKLDINYIPTWGTRS